MTICKYFQQGTCKFGNRCRFEHTYVSESGGGGVGGGVTAGAYGSSSGTSVFNRNKSVGQYSSSSFFTQAVPGQSRPSVPTPDIRDLVQMVITELMQSEQGGQWPLSCFAPFKEQACFPGLEDHSPEEIRYLMYEAVKTGNLDECTRKIKELYDRNSAVKKYILNPTHEVYSIIDKLFKGQKIESYSSPLFAPQVGSTGSSILSQTPAVSSSFTFSLSPGGDGNVQNTLGSSQPIFGNPSGSVTHSSNIFALPVQNSPSNNQSIFGGPSPSSVVPAFGNTLQPNPAFQQSLGKFNSPLVNEQSDTGTVTNQNKGIFGGSSTNWNQPGKTGFEDTIYTVLSDLSEDDKNIFSSKTFTMGKVPIKAPAKELCM